MKITATLFSSFIFFLLLIHSACQNNPPQRGNSPVPGANASDEQAQTPAVRTTEGLKEDYINENRLIWQKPDLVLQIMGDLKNKTVADIGAGSGFFSLRLARKAEKVIAIDIDMQTITELDSVRKMELPERFQDRLELRLTEPSASSLRSEEADVVLIVNTIIYIPNRIQYLEKLKDGIKAGGQLIIIDFKKKRTPVGPPNSIRIPDFQIEEELSQAGYTNIQVNDTALDFQYIVIAEKLNGPPAG